MNTDEYRRGTAVEHKRQRKQRPAHGRYRGVLLVIYAIGFVTFTTASLYIGPEPTPAVYLITRVFYAGLIRADIRSLRGQGIDWDASRHLWFGAAFTLPFVTPAYYVHNGRVIRHENESRDLDGWGETRSIRRGPYRAPRRRPTHPATELMPGAGKWRGDEFQTRSRGTRARRTRAYERLYRLSDWRGDADVRT